jgi:hypothetical protein
MPFAGTALRRRSATLTDGTRNMFVNLFQAVPTADVEPPIFSYLEGMAIRIGIRDGEIARNRSKSEKFFVFYANVRPVQIANRRLEALRAYAELARALFPRSVSTSSLEQAGFNASQRDTLVSIIGRQAEL